MILQSRLAKGWVARRAKAGTHAEFPGTTVLWDGEYFEVVEAEAMQGGGVRYVLLPWREDHVIRTFVEYSEESETALAEDYKRAQKQRTASVAARLSAMLVGQLPNPVQMHLANELGLSPAKMTVLACVPGVVLFGICIYEVVSAKMAMVPSKIPTWFFVVSAILFAEVGIRFLVAMNQNRGMGSVFGLIGYLLYYEVFARSRKASLPSPYQAPGESSDFIIPPPEDVELQDAITIRGPLLTLLTPAEQNRLRDLYGFDYRKYASGLAWTMLVVCAIGFASTWIKLQEEEVRLSLLLSLVCAVLLAAEQVQRLRAFKRGPAGSVLGVLVRPFARNLLTRPPRKEAEPVEPPPED